MPRPGFVQCRSGSGGTGITLTVQKQRFNFPSLAANFYAIAVGWSDTTISVSSVVDDKSNTWTAGPVVQDGGNNASLQAFYLKNGTAGAKTVTITLSAAAGSVTMLGPVEFCNIDTVSPVDGSIAGQVTSGTAIKSGAVTTTADGDLLLQFVQLDNWNPQSTRMTWTPDIGFNLIGADGNTFQCAQWGVAGKAGSYNPTLTSSINSLNALSTTLALKTANAGTPRPKKILPVSIVYQSFFGYMTSVVDALEWPFQLPSEGNLLVMGHHASDVKLVRAVRDSNGNHWERALAPATITSQSVEFWFARNAKTSNDLVITPTWVVPVGGSASGDPCPYFIDVAEADDVSPLAQAANATGTSAASSGTINGATLSAPAPFGLCFSYIQEDGETVTGISPGNILSPDVGVYSTDAVEKDGGLRILLDSDGSSFTDAWVYSNYESGTAIGKWATQAVSFKPRALPSFAPQVGAFALPSRLGR